MDAERLRTLALDGIVGLVEKGDCVAAVHRWRDLMLILRKCTKLCRHQNREDDWMCGLCLEHKLCEEAGMDTKRVDVRDGERKRYKGCAGRIRQWLDIETERKAVAR